MRYAFVSVPFVFVQILIEFKTTRSSVLSISDIWNATVSLANDAPLLNAEPILQFDAIGGTPVVIPLRPSSFQPNPIQPEPFKSAQLTFSVFQWSVSLGASVAMIPIQTTVRASRIAGLSLFAIVRIFM
jgi:hypothetical protein